MESMRLLQQRALRQIFQSRPFRAPAAAAAAARRQLCSHSSNSTTQQCLRSRPSTRTTTTLQPLLLRRHHHPRTSPSSPSSTSRLSRRRCRRRRPYSTTTTHPTPPPSPEEAASLSLSQRMRKLSREYGYSAVGVYLALSALDFPFCYLAVSYLGTERIGRWEHAVLAFVGGVVKWPMGEGEVKGVEKGRVDGERRLLDVVEEEEEEEDGVEDHGYDAAERANRGDNASFWTKLALAYAIHKSFIFIRVPLTAAVTPKVVKTLRGWGWKIGKMPVKKSKGQSGAGGAGVNTAKSGVRSEK